MPLISLTPDETDDLIYAVRAADTDYLETTLAELSQKYTKKNSVLIASAVHSAPASEGGSGCNLLHYAAANGNKAILENLIRLLLFGPRDTEETITQQEVKDVINWRNHSGNTPLHWAALNMHLECVKLLCDSGADVGIKNEAGHDAAFLAERADWKVGEASQTKAEQGDEQDEDEEVEVELGADSGATDAGPKTKGREIVEWILSYGEGNPAEGQGQGQAQGSASEEL